MDVLHIFADDILIVLVKGSTGSEQNPTVFADSSVRVPQAVCKALWHFRALANALLVEQMFSIALNCSCTLTKTEVHDKNNREEIA